MRKRHARYQMREEFDSVMFFDGCQMHTAHGGDVYTFEELRRYGIPSYMVTEVETSGACFSFRCIKLG